MRRILASPWRRLLTAALAALAIFVYWTHAAERGGRDVARTAPSEAAQSEGRRFGPEIGFADVRRLDEHYEKHGREFGRISRQEYLREAQRLRDAAPGGPILQAVRADGVVTRYDRDSGAFIAFNRNGVIRTFFKPNDGERYFRRQAERGE